MIGFKASFIYSKASSFVIVHSFLFAFETSIHCCILQIWVPIPGTCRQEPYEECTDVAKTKERQVAFPVCEDVPHQVCVDVPKEVCHEIPETKCAQKPYEKCHDEPRELCINVHKKIPVKASKKIPKQKCLHTDGYTEPGVIHVNKGCHKNSTLGQKLLSPNLKCLFGKPFA